MGFDFTKIDGYKAEMTAEEKLALLDKYQEPTIDYSGYVKKDLFDKTSSELAEIKKQLKARMTDDEQKEAERKANEEAIKNELEMLRKEKTILDNKSQYLGLGYDDELASDTAKAFAEGDMAKVFVNQKVFIENLKKVERATAYTEGAEPPAGRGSAAETTKEQQEINNIRKAAGLQILP